MKKKTESIIALFLVLTLSFTLLSFGAGAVSLDEKGSITINVLDRETKLPLAHTSFRLYYFASANIADNNLVFEYTDEFNSNGMDISELADVYFPLHLLSYAENKGITYIQKSADSKGKVVFESLPCGAYLVVPVSVDSGYITPTPFAITIPMNDANTGKWIYNIDASPKTQLQKDTQMTEFTRIGVKKQWQGTGEHPENVSATLLRDGKAVETVVLNAENNWSCKWENLEKKYSWSVVETDVPEGYRVTYDFSEMTVFMLNSKVDEEGDSPTGEAPPTTEDTTAEEELIYTGQLNWPVPVFSIAGLLLFSIGWAMLNVNKKEEEAE